MYDALLHHYLHKCMEFIQHHTAKISCLHAPKPCVCVPQPCTKKEKEEGYAHASYQCNTLVMNLSSATWHRPWCFSYALTTIMSSLKNKTKNIYVSSTNHCASLASSSLAHLLTFTITATPFGIINSPTRILHVLHIVSVEPLNNTFSSFMS